MDRSPSFPFPVDEKRGSRAAPSGVPVTAFKGGVTAADAYHATRAALRVEGEVLRLGNRFVRLPRYREIAFVAAGNAAASQALAAVDALGARLTQGFAAGPDPIPAEVPFRSARVPKGPPGSAAGAAASAAALELAGGLGPSDLLLTLLSPGALGALAGPSSDAPGPWIDALLRAGTTSKEVALACAVTLAGAVDGRLAEAAGEAEVETLVVERGDGGEVVGGSPTRRLGEAERALGASVAARAPGAGPVRPVPRSLGPRVGRPVVVAAPADLLRGAADAVGEKRYRPRLAELSYPDAPAEVARRFLGRLDELVQAGPRAGGPREGTVAFATTTFGRPEGYDERPAIRAFLAAARQGLSHRGSAVGAFASSGGEAPGDPAGGVVEAGPPGPIERLAVAGTPMRSGITDVGCLIVAVVPGRER
jgi:hypothetical protein